MNTIPQNHFHSMSQTAKGTKSYQTWFASARLGNHSRAIPSTIARNSASAQGNDQGLIPSTYFMQKAGEALRVTRWFRHE